MATPEPPLHSEASAHGHIYRPFMVNGPYGAHRIYSYRGPWMPPMDYGADPRHARYVDRLSYFRGLILPALSILIAKLCLDARNPLAATPGVDGLGQMGARFLPIIDVIANHHSNAGVWRAAMTVNLLAMLLLTGTVLILWARVFQKEGYSDLSILLYNRRWRSLNKTTRAQAAGKRIYYSFNVLFMGIVLILGPSIQALWVAPSGVLFRSADIGLFDGRLFTNPRPTLGIIAPMLNAPHSLDALWYLMVGQDYILWAVLFGLFYTTLWPLRRAAYRNDRAYLQARLASGLDDPKPKARRGR